MCRIDQQRVECGAAPGCVAYRSAYRTRTTVIGVGGDPRGLIHAASRIERPTRPHSSWNFGAAKLQGNNGSSRRTRARGAYERAR